jgi:hypothetical protein
VATYVPPELSERLGADATQGLIELMEREGRASGDGVLTICTERFERRLVEETSKLRVEMAELRADLRQEIGALGVNLRQEMGNLRNDLRQEMGALGTELRREMAVLGADLRKDVAAGRVELLKWAFFFWVGQVVSITAIMSLLLRHLPR